MKYYAVFGDHPVIVFTDQEYEQIGVPVSENAQEITKEVYEKFLSDVNKYDICPDTKEIIDRQKPKSIHNAEILAQIEAIEVKNIRALRDAVLKGDLTFIQQQDDEINQLRSQLII